MNTLREELEERLRRRFLTEKQIEEIITFYRSQASVLVQGQLDTPVEGYEETYVMKIWEEVRNVVVELFKPKNPSDPPHWIHGMLTPTPD